MLQDVREQLQNLRGNKLGLSAPLEVSITSWSDRTTLLLSIAML